MTIRMVFFLKRQQTHRTISRKSETPCERRITHDQRITAYDIIKFSVWIPPLK